MTDQAYPHDLVGYGENPPYPGLQPVLRGNLLERHILGLVTIRRPASGPSALLEPCITTAEVQTPGGSHETDTVARLPPPVRDSQPNPSSTRISLTEDT